jgi:hypothetical protein
LGTFVVRRKGIAGSLAAACAALLLCLSCTKPVKRVTRARAGLEPQIRATVVTIQTAFPHLKRTLTHDIVIANGRARTMNDLDRWRLIDFKKNTVTFVDEIAKTYRTDTIAAVVQRRREADAGRPPDYAPEVSISPTGATKTLLGVSARQYLIHAGLPPSAANGTPPAGTYVRELWVGEHPAVPSNLYAVLHSSDDVQSPFAPMMREVDEAIIALRGFPLADHSELPYGGSKMVLDRVVARIAQRDVPEKWLNVPAGYTAITVPGADRQPSSLPQPRRRTPAVESPPSSTGQRNP